MRPPVRLLSAALAVTVAACSTGPTDPRRANTAEILYGRGVDQYLANRRTELATLQARNRKLSSELAVISADLDGLNVELASLRGRTDRQRREITQLRRDISQANARSAALSNTSESLRRRIARRQEQLAATDSDPELTRLNQQVVLLTKEVSTLKTAVDRTLKLRANQLRRQNRG